MNLQNIQYVRYNSKNIVIDEKINIIINSHNFKLFRRSDIKPGFYFKCERCFIRIRTAELAYYECVLFFFNGNNIINPQSCKEIIMKTACE